MIRNAIQRFMYGRYGTDQLNGCLIILYLAFYLLYVVTHIHLMYWLSIAALLVALFRLLSRNPQRRRMENSWFIQTIRPLAHWFRLRRTIHRDKEHCYFKCPNCGQHLRVPRGKGKITVTCRGCGAVFEEKS